MKVERKESTDRLLQLMEVVLPHLEQARLNQVKLVREKLEDQKAAAKLAQDLAESSRRGRAICFDLALVERTVKDEKESAHPRR